MTDHIDLSSVSMASGSSVQAKSAEAEEAAKESGERLAKAIDAAEILRILRRRLPIILACMAVVTAFSAANIYQIVPRYTAEASVILEARKTQVVDVQAVLSGLPADMAVIRSEVEVLKSPTIAVRVARKLNLPRIPEFNPNLQRPSSFGLLEAKIAELLRPFIDIKTAEPSSALPRGGEAGPPSEAEIETAANILRGKTDVTNELRSYVLKIRVEVEDPKLAADIANAYADSYLESQLETKFNAVRKANAWLEEHLAELRGTVETTDRAVQKFKSEHNLTETRGVTVNAQQLAELNSQLTVAAAERAQKESNLREIENQIKLHGASTDAQVLSSPLILKLRGEQTDLMAKKAQLATKYLPAHPAMVNLDAQLKDVQEKIGEEINKIIHGMTGELAAAKAREAALRDTLRGLQKAAEQQAEAEVQLRQLEREAESNRTLYENFLQRFKQTSAQEDIQQADARLLAAAQIPGAPSYPQTGHLLLVSFGGSILIGLLAAFIVEQLDPGFRTREQFERATQVPSLGLVPDEKGAGMPTIDIVAKNPMSPYAEAIRTIRTALRYANVDHPPKVVMVTSSMPGEGKSVFSLSLARGVACSGGRSLIIDCDLRRPTLHELLNVDPEPGLLALFEPGANLEEVRRIDELSGMHYITGTAGMPNPQDLLGSNQMATWIEKFRGLYDFIVLDTPPILSVSDAVVLSHLADTTIFLARWGKSARRVVTTGLRSFRANGGPLAGAVLSRVNMAKHSGYSYGDDKYIHGRYYREGDRRSSKWRR